MSYYTTCYKRVVIDSHVNKEIQMRDEPNGLSTSAVRNLKKKLSEGKKEQVMNKLVDKRCMIHIVDKRNIRANNKSRSNVHTRDKIIIRLV